ncbi:hypothetical protein FACS1894125_4880 [Actinomycetota bacterium]|nr:hypothetical protein FACS1894125_4880 [Actinomycetota bacterium]
MAKNLNQSKGVVLQTHRGRNVVLVDGVERFCAKSKKIGKASIVPGDQVLVTVYEGLSRIEKLLDRKTVLRRTQDDTKTIEKIIAANCTNLALVVSTTSPEPQPNFVARVLKLAEYEGVEPLIIWTKTDLSSVPELGGIDPATSAGKEDSIFPAFIAGPVLQFDTHTQLDDLSNFLGDKSTAFLGLSGVGKSTLINKLLPNANRKTGDTSANGDGKHTSTSSQAFEYRGGLIIDTPGVRSFGLGHI